MNAPLAAEAHAPEIAKYAEAYVRKYGLHLVPLPPRAKRPTTPDWGNKLLSDPIQARDFYRMNPSANMGVALGPSRICSLDVDNLDATRLLFEEFGWDLDALVAKYPTIQGSQKGLRLMFRVPDGVPLVYKKLAWPKQDGTAGSFTVFEMRAADHEQRQDVLPPSIHPDTGEPYRWLTKPEGLIPEPPEFLVQLWLNFDKIKAQLKSVCPWAKPEPLPVRANPNRAPLQEGSVIDAYNEAHGIEQELARYGYTQQGRRWLSPSSTTGLPGVNIIDGNRAWIHHASDPLSSSDTGHPVAPFDLFRHYEHGGDIRSAVKAAASTLGMAKAPRAAARALRTDPETGEILEAKVVRMADRRAAAAEFAAMPTPEGASVIRWEGGNLPLVLRQAEHALMRQSEFERPYRRGSSWVRLTRLSPAEVAASRDGLKRQRDTLAITDVTPDHLTVRLAQCSIWEKFDARKDDYKRINPPAEVAKFLLAIADEMASIPRLVGVIEAPTLRPDGSLLDVPGYDEDTAIFYDPNGVQFPPVPERLTRQDAINAMGRIAHLLRGFPFSDDGGVAGASLAVALSAVLTAVCRRSLPSAPLHAFDAPTPGSGKSLLADFISIVATGRPAAVLSHTDDAAEERKRILALLAAGDLVVAIDNIERPLGSDVLCSVLTQSTYQDRVLGQTKQITVPTSSLFLATGNNLRIVGDLVRRVLMCRLDPACERPDERVFDFNLKDEATRNRPQIVADALTVLRAYVMAGKPKPSGMKAYGSFEAWSDLVRGALMWTGHADPLANRAAIEEVDPERSALRAVFSAWHAAFGSKPMTAPEVIAAANSVALPRQELQEALDQVPHKIEVDGRVLGNWIRRFRGRVENGLRLTAGPTYKHVKTWKMVPVGESGESGESVSKVHGKLSGQTHDISYKSAGKDSPDSPDYTPPTDIDPDADPLGGYPN